MTDPLEAELDQLFRLPASGLVDARNALAERLKKTGDKAAAARVKALKRPNPAAWAINQVFFRDAELLERARAQTLKLRELHAQDGVEPRLLAAAVEAQRAALQGAVELALRICAEASVAPAASALQRRIFTTLQAWLAGTGDEAPGRMTHDIEASGFSALGAIGEAARELPPTAATPSRAGVGVSTRASSAEPARRVAADADLASQKPEVAVEPARDPRAEELERAVASLEELEAAAQSARDRLQQRRGEQERARVAFETAQGELNAAERRLQDLRGRLAECERDLARGHTGLDEAEQAQQRAEAAAACARTAVAALRRRRG